MSHPHTIRVVQYGLGPIGAATAKAVIEKSSCGAVELVGAIDIHPEIVGKDVASIVGLTENTGVIVSSDPTAVLARVRPHVVLHATSSFLSKIVDQLEVSIQAGAHVVSSSEELLYPFARHPEIALRLDVLAAARGVALLGTGVNPGFAMDSLALMATGVCQDVRRINVERVVDASSRRLPLQQKIGAGLSPDEFNLRKASGTFGHIGLRESLLMLADGLAWKLDHVEESLECVIAKREVRTPYLTVKSGEVAGIHHRVAGMVDGDPVVCLDLEMYVGADKSRDVITIQGNPPVKLVVPDGIFGDTATVAALVNAIPLVMAAKPGLRTIKDIPLPRAFATQPAQFVNI